MMVKRCNIHRRNLNSFHNHNQRTAGLNIPGPAFRLPYKPMRKPKRIKVFLRAEGGRIACICLRSHRLCNNHTCEADIVQYDQYQHLRKCFENEKGKP